MDAKLSTVVGNPLRGALDRRLAVRALTVAGFALTGFAALLFARRLSGALERPAPAVPLVVAVAAIGLFALASRHLGRAAMALGVSVPLSSGSIHAIAWGPSAAMVLLTFGLSWPLDRVIDWVVWVPLWTADFLSRRAFLSSVPPVGGTASNAGRAYESTGGAATESDESGAGEDGDLQPVQQLTRLRDSHGRESIVGVIRADFLPSQRAAEVYVGFCPPFDGVPSMEVEQSDGPPARLTVTQVVPHGARVEVKLQDPPESADTVVVELYVSA